MGTNCQTKYYSVERYLEYVYSFNICMVSMLNRVIPFKHLYDSSLGAHNIWYRVWNNCALSYYLQHFLECFNFELPSLKGTKGQQWHHCTLLANAICKTSFNPSCFQKSAVSSCCHKKH